VLLLNALVDREYDWLLKDLLGFMTNSKIQILADDNVEQIETKNRKKGCIQARDTVMAVKSNQSTQPKLKHKCSVYGRSGHTNDKCGDTGGGCKGKVPNWWKKKREKGRKDGQTRYACPKMKQAWNQQHLHMILPHPTK